MSNNDKVATGTVEGTGSSITISCGFKPQAVFVKNVDGEAELFWNDAMNDAAGWKTTPGTAAGTAAAQTFTGTIPVAEDLNVADDDNAASTGVAVYLHTKDGNTGWFEFVSPTDADGTGTLNNGGNTFFIFDSDTAATDGVAIYLDEDAANADERLLCVSPSGLDILVPVGGGKSLRVVHDASAASNGVQVYFDEDAANTYDRLMFVSPTDTAGTGATDDVYFGLPGVPAGTNGTSAVTSAAGNAVLISSLGVTPRGDGFDIGADTDVNVSAETINWFAIAG